MRADTPRSGRARSSIVARGTTEDLLERADVRVRAEANGRVARPRREARAHRSVAEHDRERVSQGRRAAGEIGETSVAVVGQPLTDAADIEGDRRHAELRGFEADEAERLRPDAGNGDDRCAREQGRARARID